MAQQVLGAVGAAIGYIYGGPTGAQIGWTIGSTIGGALDPQVLPGPRIGEIAQQTSQEGVPRPIVFALSPPIPGNIVATSKPEIVRTEESQGKGGPKVEVETVFRTYAIGVCEGPITEFVRVWRNGILVYDKSDDPLLSDDENNVFLETARFFTGAWDQEPSPDLESIFGVGTTPAHRGTAYMVSADEDLTDLRGAIPQFVFQVLRCEGTFLTSRPYPIELAEAMGISASQRDGNFWNVIAETIDISASQLNGTLQVARRSYDNWPNESIDISASQQDGTLENKLLDYSNYQGEEIDISALQQDGTLDSKLLAYSNYAGEEIDISASQLDGILTGDTYADVVIADSPVAYWKLDEASGTAAADSSGNGNDVTFSGTPVRDEPPLVLTSTASTKFNSSGYLIGSQLDLLSAGLARAYEFWVEVAGTGEQRLLDWQDAQGFFFLRLTNAATGAAEVQVHGSPNCIETFSIPADSAPHHVVLVRDDSANEARVYVDNSLVVQESITGAASAGSAKAIGRRRDIDSIYWAGWMDEIALYDYALSAARITAHYNAGT